MLGVRLQLVNLSFELLPKTIHLINQVLTVLIKDGDLTFDNAVDLLFNLLLEVVQLLRDARALFCSS